METPMWLLEKSDPGIRYLTLRDLCPSVQLSELNSAKEEAIAKGQISTILDKMHQEGYWAKPGAGYSPKYHSSVWSLIMLSQLGANINDDPRIAKAVEYYLDNAMEVPGMISHNKAPSGTFDCLQGNMCAALKMLGCTDSRLTKAYEWLAQSQLGEGVAPRTNKDAFPRYYSAKSGPGYMCGANDNLPCAWGAVKVMLAFSKLSGTEKTPSIKRAIQLGTDFLLGIDPTTGAWPHPSYGKISNNWYKFGFPVFYITDLLQLAEALTDLGFGNDPRLKSVFKYILSKQDKEGRWPLEYSYKTKIYGYFGEMKKPSKWVTYRALKLLKHLNGSARD